MDLHVERYDWTLYLVCLCGGFGMLWMVLACFGNSFLVQTKVVESLDQKAEDLLMDLMDCLVA